MQGVLLAPSLIIFCLIWSRLPTVMFVLFKKLWSVLNPLLNPCLVDGWAVVFGLQPLVDRVVLSLWFCRNVQMKLSLGKRTHMVVSSVFWSGSNDVDVNLVNIYTPTNLEERKICFDSLHEFWFLPLRSSSQGILTAMIMLLINLVETFLFTKNMSHWKMTLCNLHPSSRKFMWFNSSSSIGHKCKHHEPKIVHRG